MNRSLLKTWVVLHIWHSRNKQRFLNKKQINLYLKCVVVLAMHPDWDFTHTHSHHHYIQYSMETRNSSPGTEKTLVAREKTVSVLETQTCSFESSARWRVSSLPHPCCSLHFKTEWSCVQRAYRTIIWWDFRWQLLNLLTADAEKLDPYRCYK